MKLGPVKLNKSITNESVKTLPSLFSLDKDLSTLHNESIGLECIQERILSGCFPCWWEFGYCVRDATPPSSLADGVIEYTLHIRLKNSQHSRAVIFPGLAITSRTVSETFQLLRVGGYRRLHRGALSGLGFITVEMMAIGILLEICPTKLRKNTLLWAMLTYGWDTSKLMLKDVELKLDVMSSGDMPS